MKLTEALLCANDDCSEIYSISNQEVNTICPKCTSKHYIKLSTVLNRTEGEEKVKSV